MSQARIVVVGSTNVDMVVHSPRIPRPGETILGGRFHMVPGGKGANQAVAAARLGAEVTFVARVGADAFGADTLERLENEGINTEWVIRDPEAAHGIALILVDQTGENAIAVQRKAATMQAMMMMWRAETLSFSRLQTNIITASAAAMVAVSGPIRPGDIPCSVQRIAANAVIALWVE